MFFASIASVSTLYLALVQVRFMECNSVSAACFHTFGMVPCMVFGVFMLLPAMMAIPYLLRQNESPKFLSMFLLGCIVLYTGLDAANNISAILGYHQIYLFAHATLDTANNITGTVVGTGESHC
jgi:hypothetical protein